MGLKFTRRQYLIDKKFQIKFIVKFCLIIIISSLLIAGFMLFFSKGSTSVSVENTQIVVKKTSDLIMPLIVQTIVIVSAFAGTAVMFLTLFMSHKIAGPLYRLKIALELLTHGDFANDIQVRGDDQLQDFAKSMDTLRVSLQQKVLALKDKHEQLKNHINQHDDSVVQDKEAIIKIIHDIEEELNKFKV